MFHYAKGIRRLQRELKTSVSEFPQFGLIGRITTAEEEEQNLSGQTYARTQNEIENLSNYEQKKKEQEEYFRRIRQEWIDSGS